MMHALRAPALLAACLSLAPVHADVRDEATARVLSLPSGTPALALKRGDWTISREQRRPGDTAVYYMLTSDQQQMALSVYIDKSTVCRSSEACLAEALKNPSYQDAKDRKPFQAGQFQAVQFYLDQPKGMPVKQAHVLAAAYVDGHWFDLHLSKAGQERPDIEPLVDLLKSLVIR